jgi:hypothetical protein
MHDFVSKDFLIAKELAVAMSGSLDAELRAHFNHPGRQEDLTFAYWRPSVGDRRFTALLGTLALPTGAERLLDGIYGRLPGSRIGRPSIGMRYRSAAFPLHGWLAGHEPRR